ncbi:MAG: 50S ribosomal protein L1 [Acidobacteriota bacterium]|jgi:large subunit ribosomal protein L1|nr:50S ribosomal protein L1 [Acidobacteriota bacterium]
MPKHSRRFVELNKQVDKQRRFTAQEAISTLKRLSNAKFDESIELHLKMGADPSKGDQTVRGTTTLPHGTGKVPRVAVFAEGDGARAAEEAGADRVGGEDLVAAIQEGWDEFDILVAQPQMMRIIGPLGRKLGPRMPNKKAGNITDDVGTAVRELKGGKLEYRMDRGAGIHVGIGKVSFSEEQLLENLFHLVTVIQRARPASVTGKFIRAAALSSTMGPGMKLDVDALIAQTR